MSTPKSTIWHSTELEIEIGEWQKENGFDMGCPLWELEDGTKMKTLVAMGMTLKLHSHTDILQQLQD